MEPDLPGMLVGRGSKPRGWRWFTGRNEAQGRTWETRCRVVAADPGREFAWEVNDGWVHWGYTFERENGGTRLTESWEFLPAGIAGFRERFGAQADAEIDKRRAAAKSGIPAILGAPAKPPRVLHDGRSTADFTTLVQKSATSYRLMQRKPMWLMPVSTICGRRAAGR